LIFGDLGTMARNTSASHAKVKTGVALAKFYGAFLASSRLQLGYYWCPTEAIKAPLFKKNWRYFIETILVNLFLEELSVFAVQTL